MIRHWNRLRPHLACHRKWFLWGFLSIPPATVLELVVPLVIGRGLDQLSRAAAVEDGSSRTALALAGFFGLVLLLVALRGLVRFGMRYLVNLGARHFEASFREELYRHLESLSVVEYQRFRTGDLLARATSDIEAVRMAIGPGGMYLAATLLVVPFALAWLLWLDPVLSLSVLGPLALVALIVRRWLPRLHELSRRVQETTGELSARAVDNFQGTRVLRAFNREEAEIEAFGGVAGRFLGENVRLGRCRSGLSAAFAGGRQLALLAIVLVGGHALMEGRLTVGDFFVFLEYSARLFFPMMAVGWVLSLFKRAEAAMDRLEEIFETAPSVTDPGGEEQGLELRGEIEIRDLHFAHADGREVLRGIRVHVPAGGILGVVGRTGSGKSTLAQLLARLFPTPSGTIFVDGHDVNRLPLRTLRRQIGFVPEDAFLFSQSLHDNIAFGRPHASEEEVRRAAEASAIAPDIDGFPKRYEETVGERGVRLSGGQRQRVAIARALALDPVIVILDDCLSAVDSDTEARILRGLKEALGGRTAIFISHRISTLEVCDHIIVLEEGRIVEEGRHEELLARGGVYARLGSMQKLEEELAS